ncbi:hypothetical protein [Foetidibacter luteolus]|uniref:hypothetical protein n=1 Tax=Foetidibacter luteolus TaxID=2608880 RepID=UPI00129A2758|nr:hypothetical protein [Foetidibacter luteolus]
MAEITYQAFQKPIEQRLIDAACIYWEVDRSYFSNAIPDMLESQRKAILYYLVKQHTDFTYASIAKIFGHKSHSHVVRLTQNIEARMHVQPEISRAMNHITHLASKLDAQFITTNVQFINNQLQITAQWPNIQ